MGVIAAVDYWSKADPNAQFHEWQQRAERMQAAIKDIPGVTAEIIIPPNSNSPHTSDYMGREEVRPHRHTVRPAAS